MNSVSAKTITVAWCGETIPTHSLLDVETPSFVLVQHDVQGIVESTEQLVVLDSAIFGELSELARVYEVLSQPVLLLGEVLELEDLAELARSRDLVSIRDLQNAGSNPI